MVRDERHQNTIFCGMIADYDIHDPAPTHGQEHHCTQQEEKGDGVSSGQAYSDPLSVVLPRLQLRCACAAEAFPEGECWSTLSLQEARLCSTARGPDGHSMQSDRNRNHTSQCPITKL
jgi:hypothetical protein